MVTMETTFHKINCWQYIHAIIMAEVALLNVYCVYNCNFLEYKYTNLGTTPTPPLNSRLNFGAPKIDNILYNHNCLSTSAVWYINPS